MPNDPFFSFDDLDESPTSGYPQSPDLTASPVFSSHTPTQYETFSFTSDFGGDYLLSNHGSPSLMPVEHGSSVPSFGGILRNNTSFVDSMYTSFSSVSHSVPDEHHFPSRRSIMIPELSIHHENDDEGAIWSQEVMDSQVSPVPQSFYSTLGHSFAGLDGNDILSPIFSSSALAPSSIGLSRTLSSASNRSFDDFRSQEPDASEMQIDDPRIYQAEASHIGAGISGDYDWSSNASTTGTFDHPTPKPVKTHSKGRKSRLTEEQRIRTAKMRQIGACNCCRLRRAKCDDGIPCRACRRYYRNDPMGLERNPCRGEQLGTLSKYIMRDNAFPKGGYERFFANMDYRLEPPYHRIALDLGFGSIALLVQVQLVRAHPSHFVHRHVEYPWPPVAGTTSKKDTRDDLVFPAVLVDNPSLESDLETYIAKLVDDRREFMFFPLWRSDLKALRTIYKFFLNLSEETRKPLKQALMILILIHVGGDLRIVPKDPTSDYIIRRAFPLMDHRKVTPCFIRAQLGPIFSKMAHRLMKDVLRQLERLSPSTDTSCFPLIISTFAVLFMALESLQYHFEKTAYHSYHDNPEHSLDPPDSEIKLTNEGSDILLRFYKATACHEQLGTLATILQSTTTWPTISPHTTNRPRNSSVGSYSAHVQLDERVAQNFLKSLREHLFDVRSYLHERAAAGPIVPRSDMSPIFDRLLAQMFLMAPPEDLSAILLS